MLAAKAMAEQAVSTRNCPARGAVHGSYSSNKHSGSEYQSAPRAWRRGSVAIAAMNFRKSPILKSKETEPRGGDEGSSRWRRRTIQEDDIAATALFSINTESVARHSDQTKMPCVQFPPRDSQTLIEALELYEANLKSRSKKRNAHGLNVPPLDKEDVDDAEDHDDDDSNNAIAEDDDDDVIGFWRRSVPGSAIEDASSPVVRREPPSDRVRYIMSTRLGALPPTKRILEEYPIPKGILDALERHRHFHVDAFSLETSFDPIRVSTDTAESGNNSSNHGWECYIRRSVPMERKPVSFVLASLTVAHEQPVPPPSDIFHQHVLAAASSEAAMLAEVRQLYDHVHDAYREFRSTLHRNLDVSYLIDLAFRSSLNSISFFLEDDDDERQGAGGGIVPSEQTVKIPDHLQQRVAAINSSSASSAISKWRLAKKGAARNRRGAIALNVKSEAATLVQRHEMINKLTTFSAQEVRLMELWHSHDPDNNNNNNSRPGSGNAGEPAGLDPIAMPPALSSRFENVWRELQMPAEERLDLAIKYSSLSGSTRLTDAVVLWELSTALIREREEMLTLVRTAAATTNKSSAMIATEVAMLQDLTASSTAIKEALMLTYVEVGDFVTYGGNFYLARMEYEASELRFVHDGGYFVMTLLTNTWTVTGSSCYRALKQASAGQTRTRRSATAPRSACSRPDARLKRTQVDEYTY